MFFWTHLFDLIAKIAGVAIVLAVILGLDGVVPRESFWIVFAGAFVIAVVHLERSVLEERPSAKSHF